MPTISAHVSEELLASIREFANTHYRGKVSAFVVDLIEDFFEMQNSPSLKKQESEYAERLRVLEEKFDKLDRLAKMLEESGLLNGNPKQKTRKPK